MTKRTKRILIGILVPVFLVVVYAFWAFWPLMSFFRGDPTLYATSLVTPINPGASVTAILGGTLIDGRGGPPIENAVILVKGNRIVAVGPAAAVSIPADAARIDATGHTVMPGLIDMHVHLAKGDDLHLFVAAGVTTVRDVGDFSEWIVPLATRTKVGEIVGPRIFYSGPSFIHEQGFAQWQQPVASAAEARAEVKERIASGASVIKIVSDITPELVEAIVQEAHAAKVPVAADILGNGQVTAERAVQLGVDTLEHVSGVPQAIQYDNAPTKFSEPVNHFALMAWLYADPAKEAALIKLMVDRRTVIVPTFVVMPYFFPESVPTSADPAEQYVSPRLRSFWSGLDRLPSWSSTNDRAAEAAFLIHFTSSQQFIARFAAAGGRIAAGTDTPTPGVVPGFSLHRELELLVQAGLSPMNAIQAATGAAAEALGQGRDLGTIEAGKLADVVIVAGQPHVRIGDIRNVKTIVTNGVAVSSADILKLSARR
jgi:imidazolonepropionase-like amidohydrolase